MAFVVLGVVFAVLKLLSWTPLAAWSWWWMVGLFGAALVWWQWSDMTGMTRRREMQRDADRKEERRLRGIANMGLGPKDKNSRSFRRH